MVRFDLAGVHCSTVVMALALGTAPPALAQPGIQSQALPHVRPTGPRAVHTLAAGLARSATLRDLADRIERSDLIVYVTVAPKAPGRPNAAIQLIGATPDVRFLRILLDHELTTPQMVVLLGHELQHALEIAQAGDIRDGVSFTQYYRRFGRHHLDPRAFDTTAAQQAGERIRLELARAIGATPAPGSVDDDHDLLAVRLHSHAGVGRDTLERIRRVTSEILDAAGLATSWLECPLDDADSRCALPPEPTEFVVRLQAAGWDRASHACGVSLRPTNGAAGHFITVFSGCVEEGADRLFVDEAVIFAYTLVHEIGHLLLPEGHAFSGIMQARPGQRDWQRAARGGLRFTPHEVRLLRAALRARARTMTSAPR